MRWRFYFRPSRLRSIWSKPQHIHRKRQAENARDLRPVPVPCFLGSRASQEEVYHCPQHSLEKLPRVEVGCKIEP